MTEKNFSVAQNVVDNFLKGRSLRTVEAANNYLLYPGPEGLGSLMERLTHYGTFHTQAALDDEQWFDRRYFPDGVLTLELYATCSSMVAEDGFLRAGQRLSPICRYGMVESCTRGCVIFEVREKSSPKVRTYQVYTIENPETFLTPRKDLSTAKRLGLLGHSAVIFSITPTQ